MSTTGESHTTAATGVARPGPARVPGNLWTAIEAPDAEALEARVGVSVVVVGEDRRGHLPLTIEALAGQTYPAELTEVLVVDGEAGRDALGADIEVRRAETVEEADGDVLVVLEPGSIPVPDLLRAHVRWHHTVSDAVSVGLSRRIEASGLSPEDVRRARSAEDLRRLFEPRLAQGEAEEALVTYIERTRGLTERHPDLFWAASQGNIAVRAETFSAAGGLRARPTHGLLMLDLAWRLECLGCVLVPERRALTYLASPRRGVPLPPGADENGGGRAPDRDPRAANLVPAPAFRATGSRRLHRRPAMVVNVPAEEEDAAELLETVDAILRGRLSDLVLRLQVPPTHPERAAIEEAVAFDPRISLAESSIEGFCESPFQVMFPAVAVPDERTFADLQELMVEEGLGALHVTVPGELPRNAMVEVYATGPLARARRLEPVEGESWEVILGRLFGERWISGVEVSLRRRGAPEPHVTEHGPLAPATDLEHERTQHLRNRVRADNLQARAERHAQRAARERMRAYRERLRAESLEARLAEAGPPPRWWRLRLARRLLARARVLRR